MEGSKIDEAEEYVLKGMKILDDLESKPLRYGLPQPL